MHREAKLPAEGHTAASGNIRSLKSTRSDYKRLVNSDQASSATTPSIARPSPAMAEEEVEKRELRGPFTPPG